MEKKINIPKKPDLEGFTILIIDDEPANLKVLSDFFEDSGLKVLIARNGEDGLQKARYVQPNLILLDVLMPGIDGYDTCIQLKQDAITRDIPVIFMTALSETEKKIKGFQVGSVDFISKPFNQEEILARISTHLRLAELTKFLEKKVKERTQELQASNEQLQQEITERKKVEEELNALLAAMMDVVLVVNGEGRYLKIAQTNSPLLYRPPKELLGKTFHDVFPKNKADLFLDYVRQSLKENKPIHAEYSLSIDDKEYWFSAALSPMTENSVLLVAHDITKRKQAEEDIHKINQELEQHVAKRTNQLEEANKELESFSYSVSHDLHAPLRSIDGFSEALLDEYQDKVDEQGKNYLQRIRLATHHMAQLIDDMLKLSKVSRGEMNFQQVNLSEMIKSIADELRLNQPERQVEFVIKEGVKVQGDSRLLRIALENLMENAWKYTSKHPTALIEFGLQQQNERPVYFIRDNGAGFDMNYSQKLFGAFQRLHSINEFAGTGIGLATVQRVIHRHGGKVWAEGEVEKGATLYFTIH